jgi:N6-adenosine-specific RNA methylase IME4
VMVVGMPSEFYELIARHTPTAVRRADLFSRETRLGFEGWGNEHGKFDAAWRGIRGYRRTA